MKYGGLEIKGSEANFVFFSPDGQKFYEPAKRCPDCDTSGQVMGEKAVIDYVNGGSLVEIVALKRVHSIVQGTNSRSFSSSGEVSF